MEENWENSLVRPDGWSCFDRLSKPHSKVKHDTLPLFISCSSYTCFHASLLLFKSPISTLASRLELSELVLLWARQNASRTQVLNALRTMWWWIELSLAMPKQLRKSGDDYVRDCLQYIQRQNSDLSNPDLWVMCSTSALKISVYQWLEHVVFSKNTFGRICLT